MMSELLLWIQHISTGQPFVQLALLIGLVLIITLIMHILRQPLIIGYIIAGILAGPRVFGTLPDGHSIEIFAHIGITILLFMVGLGLNTQVIKELGRVAIITGLGQVLLTTALGFLVAYRCGFDTITSGYIAISLAFSSTIIIVKLLSDSGSHEELYGKVAIGMLIVQDLVAMICLMLISSLPTGGVGDALGSFIWILAVKIIGIIAILRLCMRYILPRCMTYIARSQEFLFLFGIGWCLLCAVAMKLIGFSVEIGALLAGIALAGLPYRHDIISKMKPLRDFFIVLFFVFLGTQLQFADLKSLWIPIVVLTLFVLIVKPVIIMGLLGVLGYKKKTGMMVGLTTAQISEFSFILIGIAITLGHIQRPEVTTMMTLIGLITIAGSSYYFDFADQIYHRIKPLLALFEKKHTHAEQHKVTSKSYEAILFGDHRTGRQIMKTFEKNKKPFLIVDYDPTVIEKLTTEGKDVLYADAEDIELREEIERSHVRIIVSTIHDLETNMIILNFLKQRYPSLVIILSARQVSDAEYLYLHGADYVVIPYIVGGYHTAMMIEACGYDIEKYLQKKQEHLQLLAGR